ncbi:DinB family protein [Dyadobacter arcticus]|uniref:DinB-like domain-containing protein n=1 Tax=Dyadobacter arcticus TaxID=1078754 RepID=A0ABX0UTH2_9BACT|nr:DinB family protein [Dyadobacter arcticus]NIJ54940.1 hypothetical protein [Dyadobacter arcticus]
MKKSDINPMPPFFDRYINLVEDLDIFEAFNQYSPETVYGDLAKLKELGNKIYAEDKWTVKDILQHVIDNERIMSYRALRFSRNDQTTLPGYDEQVFGANTMADQRTIDDLMEEFKTVRLATIALFRNMDETMIVRLGIAYQTQISPLALGFVILGHPVHHMNVIRERYYSLL